MATVRRMWAVTWTGLRRWYNAEDVEPKQRTSAAMMRQLWLFIAGIPLLGSAVIGLIGSAFGWW